MIHAFVNGAVSGMIVTLTICLLVLLHRLFPEPEPYDWPRWTYRVILALKTHRPHLWHRA